MSLLEPIPERYKPHLKVAKLTWRNLKYGRCPKCESKLKKFFQNKMTACESCDFQIHQKRLTEIVSDRKKQESNYDEEARISELNNDGRKEMSKDFSDNYPE
jgi:protein-arginine kinase activator protein McsA